MNLATQAYSDGYEARQNEKDYDPMNSESVCKIEEDLKHLKWLANQMCCDLMKAGHSKAEAYSQELNSFDHIESKRN